MLNIRVDENAVTLSKFSCQSTTGAAIVRSENSAKIIAVAKNIIDSARKNKLRNENSTAALLVSLLLCGFSFSQPE